MISQLVFVLLTSVVTAVITIWSAWLLFRHVMRRQLAEELDNRTQKFAHLLEERISEGVRQGMKTGLSEVAAETVANSPRDLTKAGLGLIEETISTVFGRSGKPKK